MHFLYSEANIFLYVKTRSFCKLCNILGYFYQEKDINEQHCIRAISCSVADAFESRFDL